MKYWVKTSLMAAVAAALVGLYFLDEKMSEKKKESERVETRALNFKASDVRGIKLVEGDAVFSFQRESAVGDWKMNEPNKAVRADQDAVNAVLTSAEGITSSLELADTEKVVQGGASEKAPLGLEKPRIVLELTLEDKSVKVLRVGADMDIGTRSVGKFEAQAVYASNNERNSVFVLPSSVLGSLKKGFSDFRTKLASDFRTEDVRSVLVSRSGTAPLRLVKGEKGWTIALPAETPADQNGVASFLSSLSSLKVSKVTEKEMLMPERMSAFGLDKPEVVVELMGENDKPLAKLPFGKAAVGHFVLMADGAVGAVPAEKFMEYAPTYNALRDKRVLRDVPMSGMTRIRTASGKVFTLENGSWYAAERASQAVPVVSGKIDSKSGVSPTSTPAGKTAVTEAADLFAAWEFMTASEIIDGGGKPSLSLYGLEKTKVRFVLESSDSKTSEEILVGNRVSNNQKLVYVKRTSRAPVYMVDAGWLDKLTTLDGVKSEPTK